VIGRRIAYASLFCTFLLSQNDDQVNHNALTYLYFMSYDLIISYYIIAAMRPRNQHARDRLDAELRRGVASAAQLAGRLGISIPTVLRILSNRSEQVIRIGTTNKARYALRRPLRGITTSIPVFRIDEEGRGHSNGELDLIQPYGSVFDLRALNWPIDTEHQQGKWDGLPYPIYDMRPQGFLGRQLARSVAHEFAIPEDPKAWSDDDIVNVLTLHGLDTVGNWILGERAYELWTRSLAQPKEPVSEQNVSTHYTDLAAAAMAQGIPGSSAAGEFPKFTAARTLKGARTPQVIVKFSGADRSSTVQRWSDLLVCEHLALSVLSRETKIPSASTRIVQAKGRTFLESERFDRSGAHGRSAVISLASLNECFIGATTSSWPQLVNQLARILPRIPSDEQIKILWWYGRLIANSDMHTGNLSFSLEATPDKVAPLRLAPAYDMLPMYYAPLAGGEVPSRDFVPALPLPTEKSEWLIACGAARKFWQTATGDIRISNAFRAICQTNAQTLDRLVDVV
jgi:transcriptional regulator with XRE-family HTH domain